MSAVSDTATEWAFAVGWRLVRVLPEAAAYRAFERIADRTWAKRGRGVQQLERNLRRVCPELDDAQMRDLSREGMRTYMRYWCEAFRLPSWSRQEISGRFVLDGADRMDAILASGSGLVVASAHMGNWDSSGAWAAQRYGSVTTVAEQLKPEAVFEQFLAYRTTLGMEVLGTGETDIIGRLVRAARGGKLIALVADRDLSGKGVDVEFLGETTQFPVGPAVVSLLSGAPLAVISTWFDGPVLRGKLYDIIEAPAGLPRDAQIAAMTQRIADDLSEAIREHPQDWHMLQRLWPADRKVEA